MALKIYFCDICNESIPLQDLETGKAITVKGKVLCRNCNPGGGARAASLEGEGAGRSARHATLAFLLAVVAAGAFGLWLRRERDERIRGVEEAWNRTVGSLGSDLDRLEQAIRARLDASEQDRSRLSQSVEEATRRADRDLEGMRGRLDGFQGYLRETEEAKRRLEALEIAQTATSESLRGLQGAVEELRRGVEAMRASPSAPPPPPIPGDGAAPAAEASGEAIPATVQALLAKLKDPDAGVRWGAVSDLAEIGDPRVAPHLAPLLDDEDSFVRHNVALTLGELDARSAVPALIDALSDEQAIVRDSAITALRRLTHQNLKFDPYVRREERDRQLRAWRSWWESNGARFLEGK